MKYLALLTSLLLLACASEKAVETEVSEDGKFDTWWSPTTHGEVSFGEQAIADITYEEKFHAFDFVLDGPATVAIETEFTDEPAADADPVIYLYEYTDEGWGGYIARDDDGGEDLHSRIETTLGAGQFRVVVKNHFTLFEDDGRFEVGLRISCEGAGCDAPSEINAGNFASASEGANYTSESDYAPAFIRSESRIDANASITAERVSETFESTFTAFFEDEEGEYFEGYETLTIANAGDADEFLSELSTLEDPDFAEDYEIEEAEGWSNVAGLLRARTTDRAFFKIGTREEDGSLSSDDGLYGYIVVGRDGAGHLVGFIVGSVET